MVDAAGSDGPTAVYICDRGYASYNNYSHVIENGQHFLICCTDVKTEALLGHSLENIREIDVHVERILSRSKVQKRMIRPELAANYRHICADVPMDYLTDTRCEYDISLRIVRFETAPSVFVNLITNLSDHEFDLDDFKELYHLRWCQENAYRDIKYSLCLRALHSKKYEYVVKEVWARAILHNFSSEIAFYVEIDKPDRIDFLCIHDGKTHMDVEGLISQNIEAVRPGRIFPQQKRFRIPMSFCYRN